MRHWRGAIRLDPRAVSHGISARAVGHAFCTIQDGVNEEGKGAVELLMVLALLGGLATIVSDEVRSALRNVRLTIVRDTTSAASTGRQNAWYGDLPSLQNARLEEVQASRPLALASSPTDVARSLMSGGREESLDPKREKIARMIAEWIETSDQRGDGSGWVYLPREQTWARAGSGPEWVSQLLDAAAGVHDDTQRTSWYASLAAAGFDAQDIVPVQARQWTNLYVQSSVESMLSENGWEYGGATLRGQGKSTTSVSSMEIPRRRTALPKSLSIRFDRVPSWSARYRTKMHRIISESTCERGLGRTCWAMRLRLW